MDPIGYDDQINLYAYVANDPVNGTDPDGKQSEWTMDRRYIYPRLTEKQREGIEEEHRKIGRATAPAWGMASAVVGGYLFGGATLAAVANAGFARVGAYFASRAAGSVSLRAPMQGAVNRIINIGRNNATRGDFLGAARETAGKNTGFNHVREMQQSIRGLEKSSQQIGQWMRDSRTPQTTREALGRVKDYADRLAERMRDTLK